MNEETDDEKDSEPPKLSRQRKLAEWVTLALSAMIILGLAGVLIREGMKPESEIMPLKLQPDYAAMQEVDGRFVLPVQIKNEGEQTVTELTIEVRPSDAPADEPPMEMVVDYLGEGAEQKAYFIFEKRPEKVEARAVSYRLE